LKYVIQILLKLDGELKVEKEKLEAFNKDIALTDNPLKLLESKASVKIQTPKITVIATTYHSTTCLSESCIGNFICHEDCSLDYTKYKGDEIFKSCACMESATKTCSKCHHEFSSHIHIKEIYKKTIDEKPLLSDEEFQELHKLSEIKVIKKSIIDKINIEIREKEKSITENQIELKKYLDKLTILCPHFNYKIEIDAAIEVLLEAKKVSTDPQLIQTTIDSFKKQLEDYNKSLKT